jgi:hypothetical protein
MSSEHDRDPSPEPAAGTKTRRDGPWDRYWERFRRQQVDDPVETRREGFWERFERQQVDDPVEDRRARRRSP